MDIFNTTKICLGSIITLLGICVSLCNAADVIIVGDTQLKPVVEIITGVKKTLETSYKIYSPSEAKGKLRSLVDKEDAKVVIALGSEALADALLLPSSIAVIYDLVVIPPRISRPNTTGFYMATPVKEYSELVRKYINTIRKIAVVGSRDQMNVLAKENTYQTASYPVKTPYELVVALKQLDSADAVLLLPDVSLLTTAALEEAYLFSFRRNIPLLGISERHVKQGALLALVVDPVNVGRQIGDIATKAAKRMSMGQIPPSPARKFDLYINTDTAKKMGIYLPEELIRSAKKVYP